MQGWVAGCEGFSQTHTIAIVLAEVVNLAWMICLAVVAWRIQDSEPRSSGVPSRRHLARVVNGYALTADRASGCCGGNRHGPIVAGGALGPMIGSSAGRIAEFWPGEWNRAARAT